MDWMAVSTRSGTGMPGGLHHPLPVETPGLPDGLEGDEAHDLRARDDDPPLPSLLPGGFQDLMGRRDPEVGEVHADLGTIVLVDDPADGFHVIEESVGEDMARWALGVDLQCLVPGAEIPTVLVPVVLLQLLEGTAHEIAGSAGVAPVPGEVHHIALVVEGGGVPGPLPAPPLSQDIGDFVGVPAVGGVEVDVVGDQEFPGSHGRRTRTGVEDRRAEVRGPLRVAELLLQPLVFSGPDLGQIPAFGPGGGVLVEIDGNAELFADPGPDPAGHLGALFHGDAGHGDEGHHVGGSHAGVLPFVPGHVDDLGRPLHRLECRFLYRRRGAHEGDDRAIGLLTRVHVQEAYVGHGPDGVGHLLDDARIPALGDIGNALDDGVHACRPPIRRSARRYRGRYRPPI